ncbi:restriction endonuclease subunit S [Roseovarius mucosus]|uniref:restriction endonuclease subunit S n=1 Tax=Roseovarius mucosus TaxID=215743 RepID=UPI001C5E93F4|nr:restriction endonuclease subunit S [Roseovarius mucosus]MBW4974072.1 restriction endonuclease subunit S [Roseovarius mucosus]
MKDAPFTADRLLALYDRVAEAEDAIPRLRRFVLDLAVRGKLVAQDAGDEPAAELLKRIAKEKARLVKAGEIRASKAANPPMSEVLYDLPANWAWASLGTIFNYDAGDKRDPKALDKALWLLELEDLEKDTGRLVDRLLAGQRESQSTKSEFRKDDILYGKLRPYLNKVIVADQPGYSTTEIVAIRPFVPLCSDYCALALRRPDFVDYVTRLGQGTKMPRLRTEDAVVAPFPLPPLAEQRRIVGRVEELMALCDQLQAARVGREAVRDRLTTATLSRLTDPDQPPESAPQNARFALQTLPTLTTHPDQIKPLRQTILNLAVRGKLAEQDPTDEPAAELLKRIAKKRSAMLNADYPNPAEARTQKKKQAQQVLPAGLLALPSGWVWTTLQQASLMVIDCKNKTAPYTQSGIKLVRTTNVRDGLLNSNDQKFVSESTYEAWSLRAKPEPGDILITREAPMGEVCVVPEGEKICLGQRMMLARLVPNTIDPAFMLSSLRDPDLMDRVQDKPIGMTVQHLRVGGVETLLVPLPPLAEQHRIVAKVDALMALCDQLEASLTTATTTRSRLLEALLHEALDGVLGVQSEAAA